MDTRKVLKEALRGCDRREVAKILEMHIGSLNNQVAGELPYRPKGHTQNILDRIYNLIDITYETTGKMLVLEAFAEEFGFYLIKNPAIQATNIPAIKKISEILKDFAEVVEEISTATTDGVIERYEGEKIRAKWEIMKRMTEEFVLACETGGYDRDVRPMDNHPRGNCPNKEGI